MSDTFGDAVYEAWRRGRNPDRVDPDRIWYDEAQGYEPEECVELEITRITPKPSQREEEES